MLERGLHGTRSGLLAPDLDPANERRVEFTNQKMAGVTPKAVISSSCLGVLDTLFSLDDHRFWSEGAPPWTSAVGRGASSNAMRRPSARTRLSTRSYRA